MVQSARTAGCRKRSNQGVRQLRCLRRGRNQLIYKPYSFGCAICVLRN